MSVIIDGTTGISGVAGSASAPALIGTDADSGYYINSANEPSASVNGTAVWNAASTFGFKNRIINGAMMIDQRNAGAAVNIGSSVFPVDRFSSDIYGGGVVSAQRSTVAPTGFANSIGLTVTTADTSIAAGDFCYLMQSIEGYNVADFNSGTANAATYTLSFWVRSSLIGIYTGAFVNSAQNRARTFEYTINSANTWEYKTITVTGDTTGTWLTDNSVGLRVKFALMMGSTYQQAAGSWGSTAYAGGTSNQVNWTGTVGNTFYITGVQLEKGSTATSFDFRSIGTELALCQRYYEVVVLNANTSSVLSAPLVTGANWASWYFKQQKRATPTIGLTATGSWVNVTPNYFPTVTQTDFQNGNYFYLGGTTGSPSLYASSEL